MAADVFAQPLFAGFSRYADLMTAADWPTVAALDARLALPGRHLVEQDDALLADGLHYETRIARGRLATRADNWHDLFNALVWARYPYIKRALNTRQCVHIQQMGPHARNRTQAALTQFDESGVIVRVRDARLLAAWDAHEWRALFVQGAGQWASGDIGVAAVIGHALMEQALLPTRLLVGKCLVVQGEDDAACIAAVARALGEECRVNVVTTFLGAHAIPPGREAQEYTDEVCNVMIPAIAAEGLAEAVDVFCENIAFSPAQARQVFEAARANGLAVKIHAEQLSNQHGAELAAGFGALSADHIEHLDDAGIAAMAAAGTVAVLLPGAFYFTRDTTLPPIAALRAAGVPLALATDSNPGTSPLTSPLLAMNMGATLFRLTVDECIAGFTREAARALGHGERIGRLAVGMDCDLAIWDIDAPADLVYRIGFNPLHARVVRGQPDLPASWSNT